MIETRCNKCLEIKLSSEFYKQKRSKDCLKTICKTCMDKSKEE